MQVAGVGGIPRKEFQWIRKEVWDRVRPDSTSQGLVMPANTPPVGSRRRCVREARGEESEQEGHGQSNITKRLSGRGGE